ncbi:MAG TPA: lipoyl(octanoyl) transferase LipB [Roseiarcus sp.]
MTKLTAASDVRFRRADDRGVEWMIAVGPVSYPDAVVTMEARAAAIAAGEAAELVWLLEHPPLYTAGVSAKPGDLIDPDRFPVFKSGRGGQFTYHGPGQRVAYVMLDLRERGRDARAFVSALEAWVIQTLARVGVVGEIRCGRVGVWVSRPVGEQEDKIAAIGVKLRRWVSFHGVSINVTPNLSHFEGIVPCGISDMGVTSLEQLGANVSMAEVDQALAESFENVFGPVLPVVAPRAP